MKLYAILSASGALLRYEGTQADAKSAAKIAEATFEQVEVPVDKAGLIDHLNELLASRPQEDEYTTVVERQDPPVFAQADPSYTSQSIAIDDAWDGLPLARKAHFVELFGAEVRETANRLSEAAPARTIAEIDEADQLTGIEEDDVDPFA